ncbi:transporter periplasmic-binding protein [Salipiger pallidus]|uniref:Transporter periplasmic-binding protein n=1 Tax=Salipiger pallidus TaxID=1775170 RepID=A0A8J2ZNF4_9RHOB|nr:sugar ABC transporter substrate-binding protein [Salipiger pallidus]GGG83569.1 transporter periplasmic-binding protein [Salipiger pallidus]
MKYTALTASVLAGLMGTSALAQQICEDDVMVLAQPRDGLTLLEDYYDEFEELSGAGFQIDYLNENDRRAKSQADASTVGSFNVYYVDEANLPLFASSEWIVPLEGYYPEDYDYEDFDAGMRSVASYDGKQWFAPIQGGGDLMVYRTDLLEEAGIEPPQTWEDFKTAVAELHDPDNGVYGIALRGQRGSGANVWRWLPLFAAHGGEWVDDSGEFAFNSDAAVKATEEYLELFQYSAPGTQTGSFDESTGAFRSGKVALIIESAPLGAMSKDPSQSQVVDSVAFTPPPTPLPGSGYAHGFAIASRANETEEQKACAGLFVAWATSKEQEARRLAEGQPGELTRTSTYESPAYVETFGENLSAAMAATGDSTEVLFWQDPDWQELGNAWGIKLEELIIGSRTDIQGALDELSELANAM